MRVANAVPVKRVNSRCAGEDKIACLIGNKCLLGPCCQEPVVRVFE